MSGDPHDAVFTLVVSDLVDSTSIVTALGDRRAADVLERHDRLARQLLGLGGGREIDKSDGFLLLFEDPVAAMTWVRGYHRGLERLSQDLRTPLRARVGVHIGEVVMRTNLAEDVDRGAKPVEVDGVAKVIAARLMSVAGPGRTLYSRAATDRLQDKVSDVVWDAHGAYILQGLPEPVEILEARAPSDPRSPAPADTPKARRAITRQTIGDEMDTFVGRLEEHRQLVEALEDEAHVLTLFGSAGTGKTRLARRFAREQASILEGGAGLADLTEARDVAGICKAVARMLEVELVSGEPVEHIGRALRNRGRGLYVLDNAEQVVEPLGKVLALWTELAPAAVFLVTSREVLRVAGEQVLGIGPLAVPPPDASFDEIKSSEAVTLFVARAQQVQPAFQLGPEVAHTVAEIVRHLDGIPLALELAAARIRSLSPAAILERLPRRFDLLASARRDASSRHATLRRAIDWSWSLLVPWERYALATAAVFRGGFDPDAAEAVIDLGAWPDAPFVFDVVQALCDKSLLHTITIVDTQEIRYGLYESIREYAEDQLLRSGAVEASDGRSLTGPDAAEDAARRHGRWFARLQDPEKQSELLTSSRRLYSLDRENLSVAIERAMARGDVDVASGAAVAELSASLFLGPMPAGIRLTERILGWPDMVGAHKLAVLNAAAPLHLATGHTAVVLALADEATALASALGDPESEAKALCHKGTALLRVGKYDEALVALETALVRCQGRRFLQTEARVLNIYGKVVERLHRMDEAGRSFDRGLLLAREAKNPELVCHLLTSLGDWYRLIGRMEQAKRTGEEALKLARGLRARRHEAFVLSNLGDLPLEEGRPEDAQPYYAASLVLCQQMGFRHLEGWVLSCLGEVETWAGLYDEAGSYLHAAWAILSEADARMLLGPTKLRMAFLALRTGDLEAAASRSIEAAALVEGFPREPDSELGKCWMRLEPLVRNVLDTPHGGWGGRSQSATKKSATKKVVPTE